MSILNICTTYWSIFDNIAAEHILETVTEAH